MSPVFSTTQSRWALQVIVALLCVVAIASSAPPSAGGTTMYSGGAGDIRGLVVLVGAIGLGGVFVLTSSLLLPRPWRVYTDRLEFIFVAMLWIIWTSFTLDKGVCNRDVSDVFLPTCPLLTFDLALLHLLATASLALLLVILATALQPSYHLSLSPFALSGTTASAVAAAAGGAGLGPRTSEDGDVLVMWDLALASPPSSPGLKPPPLPQVATYGTVSGASGPADVTTANPYVRATRRDKFAEGRVLSYGALLLCSLVVLVSATLGMDGDHIGSNLFLVMVALLSMTFATTFLVLHRAQRHAKPAAAASVASRRDRALEVGLAACLFLLWPLAAVASTIFPSTPNRPCSNPAAAAAPLADADLAPARAIAYACVLATAAITAAWLASWIILARVVGLAFPVPDMDQLQAAAKRASGPAPGGGGGGGAMATAEEGRSLLRAEPVPVRPQVKYGRLVAGEAFELGSADDADDES